MKRFLVMIAILLGTVSIAENVQAQDGPVPKLFILPTQAVQDGMSTIVPEKIGELLRERVSQDKRVELMPDFSSVKASLGGGSALIVEAEQLYNSGIGQLTAGNDKKAVEAFSRAIEIMEANLGEANFDILADSIGNLALANFNAGFDLDARKGIKLFAYIRPNNVLDKEKFPKELIALHTKETSKIKKAGPGVLNIKSSAEGIIYIDGVEKGKAPGSVTDVGFGHHYLVVKGGTGDSYGAKIKVRGKKKKQDFSATLQPTGSGGKTSSGKPEFYTDLLKTLKSGQFDESVKPYLSELSNQTGADFIAFVLMLRRGSDYVAVPFVYRKSDERLVRSTDEIFNIELSNLVVGVNNLSTNILDSSEAMAESAIVTDVKLAEVKKSVVVIKPPDVVEKKKDVVVKPIEVEKPSESSNTWTYVYIAAGSLAAIGLVAGGIYLLSSDSGGSTGSGFTAEVAW